MTNTPDTPKQIEDKEFDDLLTHGRVEKPFKEWETVKKGDVGEQICIDYMINTCSQIQISHLEYAHHPHDFECVTDKLEFYADAKCKGNFDLPKYAGLTALDKKDWDKYCSSDKRFFLFIVNTSDYTLYGQWVDVLQKNDKLGTIDCFDKQKVKMLKLADFKALKKLSVDERKKLDGV